MSSKSKRHKRSKRGELHFGERNLYVEFLRATPARKVAMDTKPVDLGRTNRRPGQKFASRNRRVYGYDEHGVIHMLGQVA